MKLTLIALLLAISIASSSEAQIAQTSDQRATTRACDPRKVWNNAEAESCIGFAYHQGADERMWESSPHNGTIQPPHY
jgi:hypothetical protein